MAKDDTLDACAHGRIDRRQRLEYGDVREWPSFAFLLHWRHGWLPCGMGLLSRRENTFRATGMRALATDTNGGDLPRVTDRTEIDTDGTFLRIGTVGHCRHFEALRSAALRVSPNAAAGSVLHLGPELVNAAWDSFFFPAANAKNRQGIMPCHFGFER